MNGFGEKEKGESAAERVSDAARQMGDTVQELAREVGTQADRAASALYEQGATASGYLSRFAAEQPITALLLAAAFGYGLAYLIHRSD